MTDPRTHHEKLTPDGRLAASADVSTPTSGTPNATFHLETPATDLGAARELVDTVVDSPEVAGGDRLTAAVPRGDETLLGRVRERFTDVDTHTAGATVIIDAATRTTPAPD